MLRKSLLGSLVLFLVVAMVACDTVTDLGEVTLEGRWDSVGELQAQTGGVVLMFTHADADGVFGGTWRDRRLGTTGALTQGLNQDGQIQFTLQNFQGADVQFTGELSNRFQMRGDLIGYNLGRDAVFRLSSN
jgi:hypothetical protein